MLLVPWRASAKELLAPSLPTGGVLSKTIRLSHLPSECLSDLAKPFSADTRRFLVLLKSHIQGVLGSRAIHC
jgi:hypothetical protein